MKAMVQLNVGTVTRKADEKGKEKMHMVEKETKKMQVAKKDKKMH